MKTVEVRHPLVQHKLTLMRMRQTPVAEFRRLVREVALDKANGVLGKTVIHPAHVSVVNALSELLTLRIWRAGRIWEMDFRHGDRVEPLKDAGEVWTQEDLAAYITDPNKFVQEKTGDSAARTKMTFKLNKNQADIAAYLASASPATQ